MVQDKSFLSDKENVKRGPDLTMLLNFFLLVTAMVTDPDPQKTALLESDSKFCLSIK
jgi:hypothetical protein